MNKRPIPTDEEIAKTTVELPVLFGKEPGAWIVPAYAGAIVVLVLGLLLVPGLLAPSSRIHFDSSPAGAAVYLDGKRLGSTPLEIQVPAGEHRLRLNYPGFSHQEEALSVSMQPLGSLFGWFPRTVSVSMDLPDPAAFARERTAEFSRWSLAPNGSLGYHVAPVLVPAVQAIKDHMADDEARSVLLTGFLTAAATHTGSQTQARDWTNAWQLAFGTSADAYAVALLGRLGLWSNNSFGAVYTEHFKDLPPQEEVPPSVDTLKQLPARSIAGRSFSSFEGTAGTVYLVDNQETDEALWARFLAAHPEWDADARDGLVAKGLVDSHYLEGFDPAQARPDQAMRRISHSAALAFLDWFQTQLPAELAADGYVTVLPGLLDWHSVDQSLGQNGLKAGSGPWLSQEAGFSSVYTQEKGFLRHWTGGVFEHSAESAALHPAWDATDRAAALAYPGFQYHLLGGALSIAQDAWKSEALYALPSDWTSEVAGMRIWLIKAGGKS